MTPALTAEESARVAIVYASALVPLLVVALRTAQGRMPPWLLRLYGITFALAALGWELWITYGWVAGTPVSERRSAALNLWIPQDLNWLMNSLADAGAIGLVGVVILGWTHGARAFSRWHWSAAGVLLLWFVAQNVWVELRLYHAQLAPGVSLSWAPLMPAGPWWNPVVAEIGGRSLQFQTQVPWVLMTPLFYGTAIFAYRRWAPEAPD